MQFRACLGAVLLVASAAASAQADTYPSKPVKLIVPYPPGGPVDFVARSLQASLGHALGQTIVVENKGGAGGNIAAAEIARAPADGYTLSLIYETHATTNLFYKDMKFDAFNSFDYLSLIGHSPLVVLTPKSSTITDFPKLIAAAKAAPGKFNAATTGPGAGSILKYELFHQALGVKVTYVPFKGAADAMNAVVGGQVDYTIASLPAAMGLIGGERVNVIAIGSLTPSPLAPKVPPLSNFVKDLELTAWIGLVGPKGMPDAVRQKVVAAAQAAARDPEVRKRWEANGFVGIGGGPDALVQRAKRDYAEANDLIKRGVLTVD